MHDPTEPEVRDILMRRLPRNAIIEYSKCEAVPPNGQKAFWTIEAKVHFMDTITVDQLESLRAEWADRNCSMDVRIND